MSLLSGWAHAVGDVVAPIATAAGAIGSVGNLLPNQLATSATNLGHNISNPNVTLSNPGGILANNNQAFSGPGASYGNIGTWGTGAAQPTANSANTSGTVANGGSTVNGGGGYGGGSAGGSGGSSGAAVDPAYGLYASQAQSGLDRALGAYNSSQAATNQQYGTSQNELTSALGQATQNYNQGLTTQDQTRLTNDNQIHQSANSGYQSLLRMLGAMGAGGGSEAQYLVPQLVGQNLSQQLGGADQTAASNKQSLTSNYNNYTTGEKQQQQKLNDWKTQQTDQANATYNTTKGNLSSLLAALNSHADTAANLGSQVNAINAGIPNTIASNQTYTGVTPTYTAPQLSTFESQASPQAQLQANTPNANSTTPYLSMLLGDQQKKLA